MKTTRLFTAVLCLLAACATSAFATTIITLDELGHITIDGAAGPAGIIARDPISNEYTLSYALPFAGNRGDVVLAESPTNGTPTDILRFPGNGQAYFFSDIEAGDTIDPADVPQMPTPITPNVVLNEVGPEGNNGAVWQPGAAGIGGNANSPSLTYNIVSDVPEPTGMLLAGMGGGLLWALRRRR